MKTVMIILCLTLLTSGTVLASELTQVRRRSRVVPMRGRAKQMRMEQVPRRTPTYRYPAPSSAVRYDRYESLYPRYTGGFHARYFQQYGIPAGDRSVRGLAW